MAIQRRERITKSLDAVIDYSRVVSIEVGEDVPVAVYQQIRQRLRPVVSIAL
ncbi:MAG: hypothetical protein WAT23_15530 [Chromatiaceae bacterium]